MREKAPKHRFENGYCTNPNRDIVYEDPLKVERLTITTAQNPEDNQWYCGYEFQCGTFLTSHLVLRMPYCGFPTEEEAKVKAFDIIRTELAIRGHARSFITNTCLREAKYAERAAINRFVLLKQAKQI